VYKNAATLVGHDGTLQVADILPGSSFRGSMTYRTNT
jgi:hypothetical protein